MMCMVKQPCGVSRSIGFRTRHLLLTFQVALWSLWTHLQMRRHNQRDVALVFQSEIEYVQSWASEFNYRQIEHTQRTGKEPGGDGAGTDWPAYNQSPAGWES